MEARQKMIGYRLCKGKTAQHPFFIESVAVNLYTAEELCYFFSSNPYLIDDSVKSPRLTRWVAEEIGLPDAALKMERALKSGQSLADFLLPVFQEIHYLSAAELRTFARLLETMTSGPIWVRQKRKADALAKNARCAQALAAYHTAVRSVSEGADQTARRDFLSSVWFNTGTVEMRMFAYQEGAEAYAKAYQLRRDERTLTAYLAALKLTLPLDKYRERAKQILEAEEEGSFTTKSPTAGKKEKDACRGTSTKSPTNGEKPGLDLLSEEKMGLLKRIDAAVDAAREKAAAELMEESANDPDQLLDRHPEALLKRLVAAYHAEAGA